MSEQRIHAKPQPEPAIDRVQEPHAKQGVQPHLGKRGSRRQIAFRHAQGRGKQADDARLGCGGRLGSGTAQRAQFLGIRDHAAPIC